VKVPHNTIQEPPEFEILTIETCLLSQVQEELTHCRVAGKPEKPPNSGYSLFSRIMLVSPEIKQVAAKERMSQISKLWKSMTEAEKKKYQEQVNHVSKAANCMACFHGLISKQVSDGFGKCNLNLVTSYSFMAVTMFFV
jgi:hypothetical protein